MTELTVEREEELNKAFDRINKDGYGAMFVVLLIILAFCGGEQNDD